MEGMSNVEGIRPKENQAEMMYDSLPDAMKDLTPYYGLTPDNLSQTKEDAGTNPLPHVVVKFKYGGSISLHVSHPDKVGASFEEQAQRLIDASRGADNSESVGLYWGRV